MKKLSLLLVLLLSLASISIFYLGASMLAQEAEALLLFIRYDQTNEVGTLNLFNADTGEETVITVTGHLADAGWTPDGQIWLVDSLVEGERRLRFFEPESTEESSFSEILYQDNCYPSVHWSPNREQLAYLSRLRDEFSLNIQDRDGSSYRLPAEESEMPYWSPDSQYLYSGFSYGLADSELFRAEDGSPIFTPEEFISFSPDSRYISYRDDAEIIHLYEIATGESVELSSSDLAYWSPSGRYFMLIPYPHSETLSYYDTQTETFHNVDLGFSARFVDWVEGESEVLLYTDFIENSWEESPSQLLRYNLASRETETIVENTAWIGAVYQSGDWTAVRYSLTPRVESVENSSHLKISNGTTVYDYELTLWDDSSPANNAANIAWSPDGRWLSLVSDTGLYRFDSQTGSLERLPSEEIQIQNPFWSPDSRYLAFPTNTENSYLWNTGSNSLEALPTEIGMIVGWRGGDVQNSLLYCGIG